jgi:sortase A
LVRLVTLLLMLAGMLVLLYPVVATQYNNIHQREFAAGYNRQVEAAAPDALAADRERASAYNAELSGVPILDPYLAGVSAPASDAYSDYLGTLGRFEAMARVRVPTAAIDLPVYHSTNDDVIAKGAGHLYGTSLPVGGVGTHAVLTSHTGMSNATLFDHLTQVGEGDLMYVDVYGETLAYQVDSIKVILPTEIDELHVVPGADLLTLFTCTPYAVNTHRLLVTGHRVPFDPVKAPVAASPLTSLLSLEPWMIGLIGGAVVALALIVVIVVREVRPQRDRSPRPSCAAGQVRNPPRRSRE